MNEGWIRLHRSIADSDIWSQPPAHFKAWCHLLLLATHGDYRGLRPGQCRVSLRYLAEDIGLSRTTVIRALVWLEEQKMIRKQSGKGTSKTVITILNWNSYQSDTPKTRGSGIASGPVATPEGSPVATPHYKNVKNGKVYTPSKFALTALAYWKKEAPLKDQYRDTYLKAFDKLVKEVDDKKRAKRIVVHAVTVWLPAGYIGSPAKLIKASSGDSTLKTWEKIEQQLGTHQKRSRGDDDLDELMEVSQ